VYNKETLGEMKEFFEMELARIFPAGQIKYII